MKITRKQLRTLIESELKGILSEDSGEEEGEHYEDNEEEDRKHLRDLEKDIHYDDRHVNESVNRALINEEGADCISDYMAMGYSRREAQDQCRGAGHRDHWLDVDGDGEITIKEGTPTEEMPASWQQILGNLLD
mgnify:CR=1 FL=1|jgi:hypothetical protein